MGASNAEDETAQHHGHHEPRILVCAFPIEKYHERLTDRKPIKQLCRILHY